jgi:quercetin dioxygenase-like cupin family protein
MTETERPASSSPRPAFDVATHIPFRDVTRHLWGDRDSGEVADWIYVSSAKIHHLVFGLPPGGAFRHSDRFRTIFAADELLHVLQGTMAIANPETGEVQRVRAGEAVFFRRDTWHHAMSMGTEALRVLEFFAPPPTSGASSAYAQTKELLTDVRYEDDRWTGRWPMAAGEQRGAATLQVVRDADVLWSLDGPDPARAESAGRAVGALRGTYVSTEHLTAGSLTLPPGSRTAEHVHSGDETVHVLRGTLSALLIDAVGAGGRRWFEVEPDDGFYVPEGTRHEFRNVGSEPTELLFAVAPAFETSSS